MVKLIERYFNKRRTLSGDKQGFLPHTIKKDGSLYTVFDIAKILFPENSEEELKSALSNCGIKSQAVVMDLHLKVYDRPEEKMGALKRMSKGLGQGAWMKKAAERSIEDLKG